MYPLKNHYIFGFLPIAILQSGGCGYIAFLFNSLLLYHYYKFCQYLIII